MDGENGRKTMAVRKWEKLNPDRLRYEISFTTAGAVAHDQLDGVREFVRGSRSMV